MSSSVIAAAHRLQVAVSSLRFTAPVTHVYNPLEYAWQAHKVYLQRYATGIKPVLFLGINPGPFGMVQTGIPFGQIAAVRDWLGIEVEVRTPGNEHPKRRVTGFRCTRNEISGERLWGLFARRFGTADKFFARHFVANYCPLAFIENTGRNRTPDKLPLPEREALFVPCDEHLRELVRILRPNWVIGIGEFAARRAQHVFSRDGPRVGRLLHPSPACPESNVGWAGKAIGQLEALGIWPMSQT